MVGIKFYLLFQIIIIINVLNLYLCSDEREEMTKAFSCLSLLSKKKIEGEDDAKIFQSMLLKCFITITDDEAKEILVGESQGIKSLEDKEIEKLTNIESLKNISQSDLRKHLLRLDKAIKAIHKTQRDYSSRKRSRQDDNDSEEYKKQHPSTGNSLGAMMKKMTGLLKAANNIGTIIIIFIFVYFGIILIDKFSKSNKNQKDDDKENDKKDDKEDDKKDDKEDDTEGDKKKNN